MFFLSMVLLSYGSVTMFCGAGLTAGACSPPDFGTCQHFDLNSYVAGGWWREEMAPVNYLLRSENYCVYAEYSLGHHLWVRIIVHNHAEDVVELHAAHDSGKFLCAKVVDEVCDARTRRHHGSLRS